MYSLARFCKTPYCHPSKVHIHGVACTSGQGIPAFVLQEENKSIKEKEKVCGTVHSAKLTGDLLCSDLIAVLVYDTKLVHFLSMACTDIKWIKKSRLVYDKVAKKLVPMDFLIFNINDNYNNGMGGVDIADQLRVFYRFDHWMRQSKWWHSIFWWGFGVLLVNA